MEQRFIVMRIPEHTRSEIRGCIQHPKVLEQALFDVRSPIKGHKNGQNHQKIIIFPEHIRSVARPAC